MGIKKNTDLNLTLTAEEVNLILDGLAKLPYKQVYHLIKKIQHQVVSDSQKLISETSKK